MFSKLNFLLPLLNSSTSLKIRNINGVIVYIIKEPTCTISVINNIITIKQSAESTTINLQFSSKNEAEDAHVILRSKLNQLNTIINSNNGTIQTIYYTFQSLNNTILHVDSNLNIPVTFIDIKKLFINGIFISSLYYTVDVNTQVIVWKSTNEYTIDTTDEILIEYI